MPKWIEIGIRFCFFNVSVWIKIPLMMPALLSQNIFFLKKLCIPLRFCHLKLLNPYNKAKKLCLVDILNVCLNVPEQMQMIRHQSDHPSLRKRP